MCEWGKNYIYSLDSELILDYCKLYILSKYISSLEKKSPARLSHGTYHPLKQ